MSPPRRRETACVIVIDTLGRFLLQQRDDLPDIPCPGKVGLFGGHREGEESYLECAIREVQEELNYFVSAERFAHLLSQDGPDLDLGSGTIRNEFFVVRNVPVDALTV